MAPSLLWLTPMTHHRCFLLVAALVLLSACIDAPEGDGVDAADASTCPAGTQLLTGTVHRHGTLSGPVAGASVCLVDGPDQALRCEVSDDAGEVALCVPTSIDFELVVAKPDHERVLYPQAAGDTEAFFDIGDDPYVSTLWAAIPGAIYPPNLDAHLVVVVISPETAQVEIVPEDGIGPAYGTSSGVAYLANLEPRWYSVRVATPSDLKCSHVRCTPTECHPGGWPSPVPEHDVALPVIEGATTHLVIACAP